MTELPSLPLSLLIPGVLGLYALAFIAGGIYYLEQRASRIRDQFPSRGPLASLTGYTALGIGMLMAFSIAGRLRTSHSDFGLGALVAAVAGVGFWVYHIHFDLTPFSRVRDGVLTFICATLAVLTAWWIKVM